MSDGFTRWMTPEGTFRFLVARSTDLVRAAVEGLDPAAEVTDLYGRLLTGAALLQIAQAPHQRVQLNLVHDGTMGDVLIDVWPGSNVRGRIEDPRPAAPPIIGQAGMITVSRQTPGAAGMYESRTPLQSGDVSAALQQYVLESEQVLSMFSLACVLDDDGAVVRAGGLIVQGLPGWTNEDLGEVTRALEIASFSDLVTAGDDPVSALEAIARPLSLHKVGADPLQYRCRCSKEAAVNAVLTLTEDELEEVRGGKEERVTCDFCRTTWVVTAADLPE